MELRYLFPIILISYSANAALTIEPNVFISGKSTVVKIKENNEDVTSAYNLIYNDQDLSVKELEISYLRNKPIVLGRKSGNNYQILASKKDGSFSQVLLANIIAGRPSALKLESGQEINVPIEGNSQVLLSVRDQNNNPVSGVEVSWIGPNTISILNNVSVSDNNGIVSNTITAGQTVGNFYITAQVQSVLKKIYFSVVPGANIEQKLKLTERPEFIKIGQNFSISLNVLDEQDLVFPSNSQISVDAYKNNLCTIPSNSLSGTKTKLFSNGYVTFSNLNYNTEEPIYLKFSSPGVPSLCSGKINSFYNIASKIDFFSSPSSGTTHTQLFPTVGISIQDHLGRIIRDASNVVSIGIYQDSACTVISPHNITGTKSKSATVGYAVFRSLTIPVSGTYYIKATSPGLQSACSNPVIITGQQNNNLTCSSGFEKINNQCLSSCSFGQFRSELSNECVDSSIECSSEISHSYLATKSYSQNIGDYGSCTLISCMQSYHIENNSCISNQRSCFSNNGIGVETWDQNSGFFSSCELLSCNPGYNFINGMCYTDCPNNQHINPINLACENDIVDCTSQIINSNLANKTWTGSSYGICTVQSCLTGYNKSPDSLSCESDSIDCSSSISNSLVAKRFFDSSISQYGSCVLESCSSGYSKSGNSCISNTVSCTSDIANSSVANKTYNQTLGSYGSCNLVSCNPGYSAYSNQCMANSISCTPQELLDLNTANGSKTYNGSGGYGSCIPTIVGSGIMPNGTIRTMEASGNDLFIGGAFTHLLDSSPYATFIDSITGLNAAPDQVNGKFPVFNGTIRSFAYTDSNTLWVGGEFTQMNGQTRNRIAKLVRSGESWIPDNVVNQNGTSCGVDGSVQKLVIDGDNVFILGEFLSYRDNLGINTSRPSVVRIRGSTCELLPFNARAFSAAGLGAFAGVIDGNNIIVGGRNSFDGKIIGSHLVKLNKETGSLTAGWPDWAQQTVTGWNTYIYDLKIVGSSLYVAGQFGTNMAISGVTQPNRFNILKVNKDTGILDSGFQSPFSSFSTTNFVKKIDFDTSGNLVVAGTFKAVGNSSQNLIKLNPLTGSPIAGLSNQGGSGSGTARSLGILATTTDPILGGNSSQIIADSYDYSVSNGEMTLNYWYETNNASAINNNGSGTYEIPLPPGWEIDPAVTNRGIRSVNSKLGTGTYQSSNTAVLSTEIYPGDRGLMVWINFGVGGFASSSFGQLSGVNRYLYKFTATIPVVKKFSPSSLVHKGSVKDIFISGNNLYAVGKLSANISETSNSILKNISITKLNLDTGESDPYFSAGVEKTINNATDSFETITLDGSKLLVGGNQTYYGGKRSGGLAKLTKDIYGNWKINQNFSTASGGSEVRTIAIGQNNDIYVGGTFTSWNGSTRNRVAKINATSGELDTSFAVGIFNSLNTSGRFNGLSGNVNKILIDGNDLIIAGAFSSYIQKTSTATTTVATPYWLRVNLEINTETVPVSGAAGLPTGAPAIEILDMIIRDNYLYAVGDFASWGGDNTKVRIVKALKSNGNPSLGAGVTAFSSPSITTNGGRLHRIEYVDNNRLMIVGNVAQVGTNTSASGVFIIDSDSGTIVTNYSKTATGGSIAQPTSGFMYMNAAKIINTPSYIYIIGSHLTTYNAVSIRRINKSDYLIDQSFGATAPYVPKPISAAIIGDELIIGSYPVTGADFAGISEFATVPTLLFPKEKLIYSIDTASGLRKNNL